MEEIKEELLHSKKEVQTAESLKMENGCLKNEIKKRDVALNDYDCHYKQLMVSKHKTRRNILSLFQIK